MMKIGKLEKVDPRLLWQSEASDFTPWLAKEVNIEILGDVVGLELEVISEEKNVGPFRADILCKSRVDDAYVLIENQLERTDHTHLGQLLTYAAGLDAVKIIWIATRFTEEHRAALDWLNRHTDDKLQFFGIELEAFRIGDSNPAPLFQLISKPNDWSKAVAQAQKTAGLSDTSAFYIEYWTALRQYFEAHNSSLKSQKPQPQHWTNFAIGRSDFGMAISASQRDGFIRIELNILGEHAKERFDRLEEQKELSFDKVSPDLNWARMDDKKMSGVFLRKDFDVSNRNQWETQFEWAFEMAERYNKFFRPLVKKL